jgi:acetyl esterase/lipase
VTRRLMLSAGALGIGGFAAATRSIDILDIPAPKADQRLAYGSDPLQFGDLRLPEKREHAPIVVFIHGGFWKAAYNLDHAGHLCAALTRAGAATWSLEYRRIGNSGGGWPGTFDDIRQGASHVLELAGRYKLDAHRVVVAGHSAGGQLALWLASQQVLPLRGAVALAGVADLKRAYQLRLSNGIVEALLGGSPENVPGRYAEADPMERLPIKTPQRLVHGTSDDVVPFEIAERFARASKNARLIPLQGSGHFELIDPRAPEWNTVSKAILDWSS